MNRTTLIVLSLALFVLLGMVFFAAFIAPGGDFLQQASPHFPDAQQSLLYSSGRGMGPGMMGSMDVFIDNEYDFLVHMIPHHEEAVYTAGILKESTEREEMKKFAEDIIRTQSEEIKQMTTWLAIRYPNEDHSVDYRPMMRDLENLRGEELDQAFLEDMIPHHMAAVMMSQQLLVRGLAEHEEVVILARNIRNIQRNEIHIMSNWLSKWYGNAQMAKTSNGNTMVWIGLIAAVILIVLIILLINTAFSRRGTRVSTTRSARELLDMRYVKSEISREEYLHIRKNLES